MQKHLLYYIDGYHGGIRGHMPLGCWRDILETLKSNPAWKLCLDVEPISWDALKERDPAAYAELRAMLRDTSDDARLEIVSGSYGQPYAWITDGECNIRQLTHGLAEIKKHFPWVKVTTYATQEPCWTSAMPQILRSLHFERAVLKNPSTAWGGYSQGHDAEICLWEGPDGTTIPLVPRYACEDLVKTWETESVDATEAFTEKCAEHGIAHPTGMIFQDLGWPSWPRLGGTPASGQADTPNHVVHTTWKEYFTSVAGQPMETWRVTQETFTGALPWGERVLVRMARQVRRGEKEMLQCERLHALGAIVSGQCKHMERMQEAWNHLLMSQHHDGWICAANGKEEENWAWKTSAQIYAMESLIAPISRDALEQLADAACTMSGTGETLCVANTLGQAEKRTVSLPMTSAHGVEAFRVWDGDTLLPSQYDAERTFPDGSKNAGTLSFQAQLPAYGVKSFRVEAVEKQEPCRMAWVEDSCAWVETDIYRICFDLIHGGTISSLFDKRYQRELVDANAGKKFNEYSGFFVEDGCFHSSTEHRASAAVLAEGPVTAALEMKGQVGNVPFTQTLRVNHGEADIRVQTTFRFPEKTYIGDPHQIVPADNPLDAHRSYHDGQYKLNAWFPTSFEQKHLDKDAAYDVCRSQQQDTTFTTWNTIKHNIALGWVDVTDDAQGLAIMTDHTTSYSHGKDMPLGLTMAWGWDGGYWWGRRQLKGEHTVCYAIVPHKGNWQQGNVWHQYQQLLHRPVAQRVFGGVPGAEVSLLQAAAPVEMSAAHMEQDGSLTVRLFNPGEAAAAQLSLDERFASADLVELDGTQVAHLPLEQAEGRQRLSLPMPKFGIRTLRLVPKC